MIATARGAPGSFIRRAWPIATRAAMVGAIRPSGMRDGSTATTPWARSRLAHRLLEMEALEPLGQQQDEERLVHRPRTL